MKPSKTETIKFRLTTKQKAAIYVAASRENTTVTQLLRRALNKYLSVTKF
jgi:uncharacterized protein (DUF1778 family)